jgi:hypothetical protein
MFSTKASREMAAAAKARANEKGVDHVWYSYEKRIDEEEEDFFEFTKNNKSIIRKKVGLIIRT